MDADLDRFFEGYPESRRLFDVLLAASQTLTPKQLRVTRSQIAFYRRRAFAWIWIPARSLRRPAAPLVLSVGLRYRHPSPRWKEIVEPYPGRFTHHVELFAHSDIDAEVTAWLRSAWEAAG